MKSNYKNTGILIFDSRGYTVHVRRANRKDEKFMVYSEETKKELDSILNAFEGYIDGQNFFDVVYSKKAGYLWVAVDDPGAQAPEQISEPEDLLYLLFNDIINDVVAPRQSTSLTEPSGLTEQEALDVRSRAATILEMIPDDTDEYLDYLDGFIQDYQERHSCRRGIRFAPSRATVQASSRGVMTKQTSGAWF